MFITPQNKFKYYFYLIAGTAFEILLAPFLLAYVCLLKFKPKRKKPSIFIGMMHINNLTTIAQGLRDKGYNTKYIPWSIPEHELAIPYDVNLSRKFPWFYKSFIGKYLLSFFFFIYAAYKFDVFILPFTCRILDRTVFMGRFEVPFLQLCGHIVILNSFGGDVQTPRMRFKENPANKLYLEGFLKDANYAAKDEKKIYANARILERQADCIISAIDHVDYLKRTDEYFHLRCIDPDAFKPVYKANNKTPVILHAPNHRLLKGTDTIIEVTNNLNKEKKVCDLRIYEKTPQSELMQHIQSCDIVADQLILGCYARLAIESMAYGKPVICYLRQDLFQSNPIWKECPIISATPDTFEETLIDLLKKGPDHWEELGIAGRKYVEKFHSKNYVVDKLEKIILNLRTNKNEYRTF